MRVEWWLGSVMSFTHGVSNPVLFKVFSNQASSTYWVYTRNNKDVFLIIEKTWKLPDFSCILYHFKRYEIHAGVLSGNNGEGNAERKGQFYNLLI